jgi:hypothetical protein
VVIGKVWKKGTRSNGSGGNNCVEVKETDDGFIAVRHSQDPGTEILYSPAEWAAFVASVKLGEFDLP